METLGNNLGAKGAEKGQTKYICEKCDFICCKKYSWERHLLTAKHNRETYGNIFEILATGKWANPNTKSFLCDNCNKGYHDRTGLWKHKKKCNEKKKYEEDKVKEETTKNEINFDKDIMLMLINQNKELLEIVKNGTHNTNSNNTHTNSHNKAFNLNFFLNETCKNAMNITDFVDSIKLQLSDLMEVGELGYVEGISKIIVKNLNNLDETVRPVHCTDKKRETMYIKDQGEWNKEDEKKSKLKKAITRVANKNIRLLPQFREKYPDYGNSSSKISDVYNKMIVEAMETDDDKKEKIIKNISKVTTIADK